MKQLLYFVVLILLAVSVCLPIMDPDLWWHIVIGRWIIANKSVPDFDYWTLFGYGKAWVAYSWSNEVVYALLDKFFGVKGLLTLKVGLHIALVFSCAIAFSLIAKDWFFGLLLSALVIAGCANHLTLRPQLLVFVILPIFIACLEKLRSENFSLKTFLILISLSCVWANSHITTIFGILTCIFWLWGKRNLQFVLPGIFAASLITPYFGAEWLTFLKKSGHPLNFQAIAEFQPASILDFPVSFLFILLFILNLCIFLAKKDRHIIQVVYGLSLFFIALAVNKFIPFALITLASVLALFWQELGYRKDLNFIIGIKKLQQLVEKIPVQGLAFVCLALSLVHLNKLYQAPLDTAHIPKATYDFYIEKKLPRPLLNDFGRGGYVLYRNSDESGNAKERVAIDGRTNVTPYDVWLKFNASYYGKSNWQDFIKLAQAKSIIWSNTSPFVNLLKASGQWCQVFQEGSPNAGYSLFVIKEEYLKIPGLESQNCESL